MPGQGPAGTLPLGSWARVGAALAPAGVCGRSWSKRLPQAAVLAASGLRGGKTRMHASNAVMSRKLAVPVADRERVQECVR